MTEPGTGSDLQNVRTVARRDGDHYLLSGAEDLHHQRPERQSGGGGVPRPRWTKAATWTAAPAPRASRCSSSRHEDGTLVPGFRRGRNLDKIGMKAQDTSELFFDEVRVPAGQPAGRRAGRARRGRGPGLRPADAGAAAGAADHRRQGVGAMERALADTLAYTKERKAFGKPVWSFQNTRFKLAEVQATVLAARAFVDACMVAHLKGELDAARAALAK
jgi:acyl-CoA dehydrogenase